MTRRRKAVCIEGFSIINEFVHERWTESVFQEEKKPAIKNIASFTALDLHEKSHFPCCLENIMWRV
jgi:hypothetical protein